MTTGSVERRVRELVEGGDVRGATTEALRSLGPEVLQYLRSLLRDEDAAADAFSLFSENVWNGLSGFRWGASLRTWSFRIATHVALDLQTDAWHRHGRRLRTTEASELAEQVRATTVVRVERQRRAFERLREALSLEERSLLALRIDRELSWAEIAEVLSREGAPVEVAAVMKRFQRLKERLAKLARTMGVVE